MIHVGTSGWQYDSWRGRLYPRDVAKARWLSFYATRFPVVEVNNSFYQLPKEQTFNRWREEVPERFLFVVKASRYITHIRRLSDCKEPVDLFWSRVVRLGDKLGPVLFQLPPNFKADPPLLSRFLELLPGPMRAAFEFRHESWRTDEILATLDRHGAAWVLADRPGSRVPPVTSGGWSYIRFHQGRARHPGYTRAKLRAWADRIARLKVRDVFVFFNNDELAAAPTDAATMAALLRKRNLAVA